jgi:hypothetical protein
MAVGLSERLENRDQRYARQTPMRIGAECRRPPSIREVALEANRQSALANRHSIRLPQGPNYTIGLK